MSLNKDGYGMTMDEAVPLAVEQKKAEARARWEENQAEERERIEREVAIAEEQGRADREMEQILAEEQARECNKNLESNVLSVRLFIYFL